MKNFNISAIALAISLAFSAGAMAETMSKDQYKSLEAGIDAKYKAAKEGCSSLAGNANDICIADAKGKKNIAKAELEHNYKPTLKTRYDARVAVADANYSVAIEKCDDKAGNDKDVCVKQAKSGKVHEMADAKAQMETSKVDAVADEKSAVVNKDAAADKNDADYAVAREKCDVLAGGAKDLCLSDAKLRFGK